MPCRVFPCRLHALSCGPRDPTSLSRHVTSPHLGPSHSLSDSLRYWRDHKEDILQPGGGEVHNCTEIRRDVVKRHRVAPLLLAHHVRSTDAKDTSQRKQLEEVRRKGKERTRAWSNQPWIEVHGDSLLLGVDWCWCGLHLHSHCRQIANWQECWWWCRCSW